MHRNQWLIGLVALAVAMLIAPLAYADKKPVKPNKQWSGSVADEALLKDPPTYITTAEALEKLWKDWKIAGKRPKVDFSKEIVVVTTSRGSALSLQAALDETGDLSVNGLGTMDIRPGFRYVIATISREGVKTVNGKELSMQNRSTVTGKVTYLQRSALLPGSV